MSIYFHPQLIEKIQLQVALKLKHTFCICHSNTVVNILWDIFSPSQQVTWIWFYQPRRPQDINARRHSSVMNLLLWQIIEPKPWGGISGGSGFQLMVWGPVVWDSRVQWNRLGFAGCFTGLMAKNIRLTIQLKVASCPEMIYRSTIPLFWWHSSSCCAWLEKRQETSTVKKLWEFTNLNASYEDLKLI